MGFNQASYDAFLVGNGVVGLLEDPITLRSGGLSYWYANFRTLLKDYRIAEEAARFVYDFTEHHSLEPSNFFAVPEGPREFASGCNRILSSNAPLVSASSLRAGYKTHGSPLDRYSVGPVHENMRPVLIEDVTTTANSSTEYVMLLQELGISPLALVSMLNRQQRRNDGRSAKEFVEGCYHVPYFHMAAAETVLPAAVEILKPKSHVLEGLRRELADGKSYSAEIKI